MQLVFFVIQIIIAVLLVLVILMQKTSSDGLAGLGGSSNNLMSSKSSANFLTRLTIILAILFMLNSLILAKLSMGENKETSIFDEQTLPTKEVINKDSHKNENQGRVPLAE
ncbi:preprotein translocase subunit SecG [Rickettsiales bacterium Ac37b]|nr:preprotein translocase subunit SecG [Rickettsiales bacterium Ac37b]